MSPYTWPLPSGRRVIATTSRPCSVRAATTCRPTNPVPPATTIRMGRPLPRGPRQQTCGQGQLSGDPLVEVSPGAPGHLRAGQQQVETVWRAGVDVQLGGDAGAQQASRVVEVLVEEAVEGTDGD